MDKVVEFIKKNKVKVAGALIMIAAFVIRTCCSAWSFADGNAVWETVF